MEEMIEDTLEMDGDEELEEEADAEVEHVLYELTEGKLGDVATVSQELPVRYFDLFLVVVFNSYKYSPRKWKTRKQSVSWRNIVKSSMAYSVDELRVCRGWE